MAFSYSEGTGDGVTRVFIFSFAGSGVGYLKEGDVRVFVRVAGVWTETEDFIFTGTNQVQLGTAPEAPADGAPNVRIRRIVDKDEPYSDFSKGNVYGPDQLNNSFLQQLYAMHELLDGFITEGFFFKETVDLKGNSITGVASPVLESDAANKGYVDTMYLQGVAPAAVAESIDAAVEGDPEGGGMFAFLGTSLRKLTWDRLKVLVRGGVVYSSDYADLNAAVASIGNSRRSLKVVSDTSVVSNLEIPENIDLIPLNGAKIVHGAYTVSYAGDTSKWPQRVQVFQGTGAVSGLMWCTPQHFGAVGDGVADDTLPIQRAINALRGSFDVTINYSGNQYSAKPSSILFIPAGIYKTTARLLVEKNNVAIRGEGWFSSTIIYKGAGIINEVIRFRNSSGGETSDIGLDGGMPYNPTRSETYGAKAGLCCDLTPFFTSRNLYIANTRLQGLRAIHLWESYFENLQIRNSGFFGDGTLAGRGASIHFSNDPAQKESLDTLGVGYESTNVNFVKCQLAPVGCLVRTDAPVNGIRFIDPNTENRDFPAHFSALSESKWYINSTAENFIVRGGYFFGHEHTYASNAKLFEIVAAKPGIVIEGFQWYTYVPTGGSFPEVTVGLSASTTQPFVFDNFIINDSTGSLTTPITIDTGSAPVTGSILYSSPNTVMPTALFSGSSLNLWNGAVKSTNSQLNTTTEWDYAASQRTFDFNAGAMLESFKCRAWVRFNGATGAIIGTAKNVSGVVRNSAGNYTVTFATAMPDTGYAAIVNSNPAATTAEHGYAGGYGTGNVNVINANATTMVDATDMSVVVFR